LRKTAGRTPLLLSSLLLLGLLLLTHGPERHALASSNPPAHTIVAAGEASVPVAYQGVLYVTVMGRAQEGAAAQADAVRVEERVKTALKALGVSPDAMQAGVARVLPQRTAEGEVYSATRTIRVTVPKLQDAGPVIDAATRAGAAATSSVGLQPLPPSPGQESEAIRQAVADAERKGAAVAKALGVPLGTPTEVTVASAGFRSGADGLPAWFVSVQVRYGR
jgi:uncharacterized protein YggE